jgi:phosphoribosylformylglycinamidine (FGAM) synthase PurS component
MEGADTPEVRDEIDRLCDGLLSNPVIEDYRYEITSG